MNGFHCLMGGVFRTACEFASVDGFGAFLEERFADLPFDQDAVLNRLKVIVEEFEEPVGRVDGDHALRRLLARDLRRVADTLRQHPMPDPHESLPQNRDRYEALLRDLGLEFSPPRLFLVDEFPRPYDTMDWVATSPDGADEHDYGIVPGNYFKRAYLTPYCSDVLLAHEMIHQVIGEVDPHWLGRGLEEGIAVIFGELYVGARVLGKDVAMIYARHQWYDRRASQGNRLYAEYARMAALIYQRFGLDGLIALIQGGRERIKAAERACLAGDFDLDLPRGRWDHEYSDLVAQFTMATVPDLVVSPLARYVAGFVATGATTDEIAEAAAVSGSAIEKALAELQHHTVLVMVNDRRVDYSDVELVTMSGSLRYDV